MARSHFRIVLPATVSVVSACGGDDPPTPATPATSLAFAAAPTAALEGVALTPAIRIEARNAAGRLATAPAEITIEATSPGGAVLLSGTRTRTTRNGTASFGDLVIDAPGRSFALVAKAPGLPPVTSQPFDVFLHFKQISSGHTSACGLTHRNVTWCWGDNSLSRLGVGDDVSRSAPARVLTDLRFDTISSGGIQQCGRLSSNDVLCWGGRHPTPTPVAGRKFTWVASGSGSCGVATGGALLCWNGPEGAAVITPSLIDNGPFRVSATYLYICAIDMNQRAFCQGGNDKGELGFVGPGAARFTQPVSNVRLTSISPGTHHACGVDVDGVGWCWGDNTDGQVGSASVGAFASVPTRVDGNRRFRSISVGIGHTCGLATDGSGWCWGYGAMGQLGNGTTGQSKVPVRVIAPVPFVNLDAGGYFGCAIGNDGFTYCWGNNNNGELADGTTVPKSTAQRVVAPPS